MKSNKKNILIRADSSSTIGTGHIMRDLVLAKQYKNDTVIFAVKNLEGNINYKIDEAGYKKLVLKENTIEELDLFIKKFSINMLVIDHYSINYKYEKQLKIKNPTLKVMVLDDTYEKHYCDVLLNHNLGANPTKYKNKVPKNCKLYCGSKFTLLRDEFYKERKKKKRKNNTNKRTIFLAMGGADTAQLNIPILKVLKKFSNIQVHIVTTTANNELQNLKKYSKNKKWVKLHVNSTVIAKLMTKSDLAIVTPSVTVNEVYFMKLPFIAIKTANNQNDIYEYLTNKKYNTMKKFHKIKFTKKILKELKKL